MVWMSLFIFMSYWTMNLKLANENRSVAPHFCGTLFNRLANWWCPPRYRSVGWPFMHIQIQTRSNSRTYVVVWTNRNFTGWEEILVAGSRRQSGLIELTLFNIILSQFNNFGFKKKILQNFRPERHWIWLVPASKSDFGSTWMIDIL